MQLLNEWSTCNYFVLWLYKKEVVVEPLGISFCKIYTKKVQGTLLNSLFEYLQTYEE